MGLVKKNISIQTVILFTSYSNNFTNETNLVQNIITRIINKSQLQWTRLQSSVVE